MAEAETAAPYLGQAVAVAVLVRQELMLPLLAAK